MQRDSTVDFLKGIAILLVVIGHFNPVQQVGNFIYSFHMPLFFFLSGITFWYSFGKKLNRENSKQLIPEMLMKRVCSLCLPYGAWSVIRFFVCGDNIAEALDKLWFLPTLFGIILILAAVELVTFGVSSNGSEAKIFCIEILSSAFLCFTVVLYYTARVYFQAGVNQRMAGIFEFLGKNTLKIYIIHYFFSPLFLYNIAVTFWDVVLKIIGSAVVSVFSVLIAYVLAQSNIIGFILFGERKNKNEITSYQR